MRIRELRNRCTHCWQAGPLLLRLHRRWARRGTARRESSGPTAAGRWRRATASQTKPKTGSGNSSVKTHMRITHTAVGLPVCSVWKATVARQLLGGRRQKLPLPQVRSPAWPRSGPGHWRAAEGWRSGPEGHGGAESALQPLPLERRC